MCEEHVHSPAPTIRDAVQRASSAAHIGVVNQEIDLVRKSDSPSLTASTNGGWSLASTSLVNVFSSC